MIIVIMIIIHYNDNVICRVVINTPTHMYTRTHAHTHTHTHTYTHTRTHTRIYICHMHDIVAYKSWYRMHAYTWRFTYIFYIGHEMCYNSIIIIPLINRLRFLRTYTCTCSYMDDWVLHDSEASRGARPLPPRPIVVMRDIRIAYNTILVLTFTYSRSKESIEQDAKR